MISNPLQRPSPSVRFPPLFSSVQFSRSVVSDSATPWIAACQASCPSPTPRVHSDSRPSSQWCSPAISSSVFPFSSCPQSLPASEYFPMSQFFAWGGQSTGVSALASFLPKKSQGWSPLEYKANDVYISGQQSDNQIVLTLHQKIVQLLCSCMYFNFPF